jgi:hypothetical protein
VYVLYLYLFRVYRLSPANAKSLSRRLTIFDLVSSFVDLLLSVAGCWMDDGWRMLRSDLGVARGVRATGKGRVVRVSLTACLLHVHSLRPVLW